MPAGSRHSDSTTHSSPDLMNMPAKSRRLPPTELAESDPAASRGPEAETLLAPDVREPALELFASNPPPWHAGPAEADLVIAADPSSPVSPPPDVADRKGRS